MQYQGGKFFIAKDIVKILNSHRSPGQLFVEPFLGGANIFPLMDLPKLGNEIVTPIVQFYEALRDGKFVFPESLDKETYNEIRHGPDCALKGFVGMSCSFAGVFLSGFAPNNPRQDYLQAGTNAARRLQPRLIGAQLANVDYRALPIPDGSLVYCDPPYANTTGYKHAGDFDSAAFWEWATALSDRCTVFVSEYKAPAHWESVWHKEKRLGCGRGNEKTHRVEHLFKRKK